MSPRLARSERRQAERKAKKLTDKKAQAELGPAPDKSAINKANAQKSTGPRTTEGKARSSQNSFKHGLYSKEVIVQGEDPAELDALKSALRAEHQPANTTEEILVNEMAEQYWRIKRTRRLEATCLEPENIDQCFKLIPMIQRTMAAAERGFHKALAALQKCQKARGFVPENSSEAPTEDEPIGFVPELPQPEIEEFDPESDAEFPDFFDAA